MRKFTGTYSEFQLPPFWHALLALLVTVSLGIAYASAVSLVWGWLVGVVLSTVAIFWWIQKGIRIVVSPNLLQVGKYVIERSYLGGLEQLSKEDFLVRIRGGAHRNDVFILRGLKSGGVVVEIKDNRDPFCHWVFTARNPSMIVQILEGSDANV